MEKTDDEMNKEKSFYSGEKIFNVEEKYEILSVTKSGTATAFCSAIDKENNKKVFIKKVKKNFAIFTIFNKNQ